MNLKLSIITIITLFISLLIVSCGATPTTTDPTPDVAAVRTSAAGTVVSQFTLTAAAFTPTTSLPTNTSAPDTTATATLPVLAQATNLSGTPEALCDSLTFDPATVDVN